MNDRHLLWIRHALPSPDPTIPAHDWSLTPGGREDAARLARSLAGLIPPVSVVTSNERKAIETAEEVARALGLGPARVSDDLREVQRPWTEGDYRAAARAYLRSGSAPGWEPRPDVLRRLSKALAEHWRPEGTTIVVGHGLAMSVWAADAHRRHRRGRVLGQPDFPGCLAVRGGRRDTPAPRRLTLPRYFSANAARPSTPIPIR